MEPIHSAGELHGMIQSLGWNVHSINQNGNQFVVKIQDPESGRIIERFGPSEEWALAKAHQFAARQQHPHLSDQRGQLQKFFEDANQGFYAPRSPIRSEDLPTDPDHLAAINEYYKHAGNFDHHIESSIPEFRRNFANKANAIVKGFPQARLLDIGSSEGSFGKTVSGLSNGRIQTTSLDPNPSMTSFFNEKSQVPGAEHVAEAFGGSFIDNHGQQINQYHPAQPFDIVHESMAFQFIDPDRDGQFSEVKRMMRPGGVFLTEQKVIGGPNEVANEAQKDAWKLNYFDPNDLQQKNQQVGFQAEQNDNKIVGMRSNMVTQDTLESTLRKYFRYVTQYWDSGNFKGYAASDSQQNLNAYLSNLKTHQHQFQTTELPRRVANTNGGTFYADGSPHNADYGYYVAHPDHEVVIPEQRFAPVSIDEYRRAHIRPDDLLGVWSNNGKVYLDRTQHVSDLDEALTMAKKRNQLAIWDIANQREIRTSSIHESVLYPSITDIPGEGTRAPAAIPDTDPNRNWQSGEIQGDPIQPGSPEDQQKLNVGHVQKSAQAIDTQWWKSPDPNVWKTAVMNAFRVALLSPRKNFNWNIVHAQHIRHLPEDAKASDMFRALEFNRRRWNAARGEDPLGHLRFRKELNEVIREVQKQFPNQYGKDDAEGIALGVVSKLVGDAEHALLGAAQKIPGRFDPQTQTWKKQKPTSLGLMSSAYDAVKAQLRLALDNRPADQLSLMPDDPAPQNQSALAKLESLGLSPHVDLQGLIRQMAVEYKPDTREDYHTLDPQHIGDPNKSPGKYGAFIYSHLEAIEEIGKNINDIASLAHEDFEKDGGQGYLFRNGLLRMNMPGINSKVASFAWLLLAPTSSELGTMDTHMARALGGSHNTGSFLPDMTVDNISQPLHYYGAERALRAMKDASGYHDVPLGQYQWSLWDKLRGSESEHRGAAVLDSHLLPHEQLDWQNTASAGSNPEWDPPQWMDQAMLARRRAWTQYMQEHGGAGLGSIPNANNPIPHPTFDPDNPMRPGQVAAKKHHNDDVEWFNNGNEDRESHLRSVHPRRRIYHTWGFWRPLFYDSDGDVDDESSAVGDGDTTSHVLSLSQEGGMKFAAAWVKRGRNLNSLETYLKEQDDAMVGQPGWKHFKVAALNTMAALDWETSCPNCGEALINGICPACHWTQVDNPDMVRGTRPHRRDFRDRKDWFDTGYMRGHPHSSAQNPAFRFVFYRGQLEVDKPETSFRHLLDRLLKEHNKNIGDYDVEDKDVASGDIYQHENGIDIELQSLADNDTQNQALDRVEQWAKGMNLIGDIRPTSKADTAGSMISLEPDNKEDLAHPNGEPVQRLHLTLAHFPSEEGEPDKEALKTLTQQFASVLRPIKGVVKGMNKFEGDEDTPHVAEVDAPGLKEFQAALFKKLKQDGHKPSEKYGFKPHITIAYTPKGEELDKDLTGVPVSFSTIAYHHGGEKYEFPLGARTASSDPVEALLEASKKIKHCGDYGQLFWNPQTKKAIWVAGDADGPPEYTDIHDIEKILKVPGVKDVEVADEWMPKEEDGYVQLNKDKMQDADGGWISEDWAAV